MTPLNDIEKKLVQHHHLEQEIKGMMIDAIVKAMQEKNITKFNSERQDSLVNLADYDLDSDIALELYLNDNNDLCVETENHYYVFKDDLSFDEVHTFYHSYINYITMI